MSDETYQARLEECRRQQRARRAMQREQGTAEEFVEITATQMNWRWIAYDQGMPGTLAALHGGSWWCIRCFRTDAGQPDFATSHICQDIASGARRWVRADLAAAVRLQTAADEAPGDSARTSAEGSEIPGRQT
jgi:hypothetical protein